ncbi:hypothetical protein BLOT_014863 [Blomia tropicalis]|nr:hypothetical protein BLOT_014863 [Blomia tropicalis]
MVVFGATIKLEHFNDSSIASIHFRPASSDGALNMIEAAGNGNINEVNASPCGPFGDHIGCSNGWNNLKQKPFFFDGHSEGEDSDKRFKSRSRFVKPISPLYDSTKKRNEKTNIHDHYH